MNPNTHSTQRRVGRPDGLAPLAADVEELAAQDLDRLPDRVRSERVLALRRLVDRLEGQWLKELAGVDGRGAAGAEEGLEVGSTAAWLRTRLRLGAGAAAGSVRTARALFRGPLAATAAALTDGELSPAHAQVLAAGTRDLPTQVTAEAEPVLVEAARRLDPPRLRRVLGHLVQVADHGGGGEHEPAAAAPGGELGLAARLGAAMALLPPILGGAPSQPLDVGRTTRVVQTAQRTALAVRDGGCVFPGCARPLAWSAAHHLWHWLDGGPTDLANLVLLCRAHHRAVHEGGWRLTRQPDGRLTATPPHRRHPAARRHPSAA